MTEDPEPGDALQGQLPGYPTTVEIDMDRLGLDRDTSERTQRRIDWRVGEQ